jgi:serine/threonine protein phosphatase PrpC
MNVELAWGTDPGLHREENEDSILVWRKKAGVDALIVVCDGMGGHAAGHLASSIASETVAHALERDGNRGAEPERLRVAAIQANTAVFDAAKQNAAWTGMGSTMVVVAIDGDELAVLNVGDSPAYLFRNREAKLISQDHSWPAEQVRLGVIKPEEAVDHPMKHRLTRAIGVWDAIQAYTDTIELKAGDEIVLCSDGVDSAGVSVDEMRQLLSGEDLEAGVKRVIERCRERGAPDNVTIAVARLEPAAEETTQVLTTRRLRPRAPQGA